MKKQERRLTLLSLAILAAALILGALLWPKLLAFWQRPRPWPDVNCEDYDLVVLQHGSPTGNCYLIYGDALADVTTVLDQNITLSEHGRPEQDPYYILSFYRGGKYCGKVQFPVGGAWASVERLVRTPAQGIYWHCDGDVIRELWSLFSERPSTSFPFPETDQILSAACNGGAETHPIEAEDYGLVCQALQDALLLAQPAQGAAPGLNDEYRYRFTFQLDDHLTLELRYFDLPKGRYLRGTFQSGNTIVARIPVQQLLPNSDPLEALTFLS